ncbi:MAG: flavodoxin domain-containing protein [Candidatus Bathyarchaeota archaeon]|nr:flavodoxin domain-containing protein [Candidatus Bathyarchaeota archaeon]
MNTLVVYGTRYGATTGTAEEIAKILREEGFDVKVVNAKKEKIKDITPYDLIVVGTGVALGKWTGEIQDFVKRFETELTQKKMALFVSTGKFMAERQLKEKPTAVEDTRKIDIDDKVAKYKLHPISIGFFGGVLNLNKMNFLSRRMFGGFIKEQMGTDGFNETEPGFYDMRNWEEIQVWTKDLAQKARQ